jgi:hypothetical protein
VGQIYFGEKAESWVRLKSALTLARFFRSLHFAAQPFIDVDSALVARLVTGSEPIQVGDFMDVEHSRELFRMRTS